MMDVGYYKQKKVDALFTDPEKARGFVELTGIDALAVAIGNVHGAYQGKPEIDFDRLKKIDQQVTVPLVLHGSSGNGEKNIIKAVRLGIRKINLYSEIITSVHFNLQRSLKTDFGNPLQLCFAWKQGIKNSLKSYLSLSGSAEIKQ